MHHGSPVTTITLTRTESFDPVRVIEQAAAQEAAERITRELMNPDDTRAVSYHYEKDSNSDGDYINLVIEGEDATAIAAVQKRLSARGYEHEVEYPQGTEPPDLIEITGTDDGCPADNARAREVMDYFDYVGPLESGPRPGLYRVRLSASVLQPFRMALNQ